MYSVMTCCKSSMYLEQAMFPKSLQIRFRIPFVPEPKTPFSACPLKYFPFSISRTLFDTDASSPSSNNLVLYFNEIGGVICDNMSKLVIRFLLLNSFISMLSYPINKFIACLGVKSTSSLVNWYDPNIESW